MSARPAVAAVIKHYATHDTFPPRLFIIPYAAVQNAGGQTALATEFAARLSEWARASGQVIDMRSSLAGITLQTERPAGAEINLRFGPPHDSTLRATHLGMALTGVTRTAFRAKFEIVQRAALDFPAQRLVKEIACVIQSWPEIAREDDGYLPLGGGGASC